MMRFRSVLLASVLSSCVLASQAQTIDVIVASTNPVARMDMMSVANLFLDKISVFPSGQNAITLDNERFISVFYQYIAHKNDQQIHAYWSKLVFTSSGQPPQHVPDTQVVDLIAHNPNMISYVRHQNHYPDGVKVVYQLQVPDSVRL